jgi:hypothetical protein
MTPEEQSAESRKYSNAAVLIVPLDNGQFAVYNNARELSEIVSPADLLSAIRRVRPVLAVQVQRPESRKPVPLAELLAKARK